MPTAAGWRSGWESSCRWPSGKLVLWICYADGDRPGRDAAARRAIAARTCRVWSQQSGKLWTLLAGGTVLMVLGLVDDRCGAGLEAPPRRARRWWPWRWSCSAGG